MPCQLDMAVSTWDSAACIASPKARFAAATAERIVSASYGFNVRMSTTITSYPASDARCSAAFMHSWTIAP